MKNDSELLKDVENAIKWEPQLYISLIKAEVTNGIVSLTGSVDNYYKKSIAETVAKNIAGVKEVNENITVTYAIAAQSTDAEIEAEVLQVLKWNWDIGDKRIEVQVKDGWVTLDGELQWPYESKEAGKKTLGVKDVKGVTNKIKIVSEIDIEIEGIKQALLRSWALRGQEIAISVSGHDVTLKGIVRSVFEKDEATRMAVKAPGVWEVHNDLLVEYVG